MVAGGIQHPPWSCADDKGAHLPSEGGVRQQLRPANARVLGGEGGNGIVTQLRCLGNIGFYYGQRSCRRISILSKRLKNVV